jgi:serine/threonine-protein kinase RsbT
MIVTKHDSFSVRSEEDMVKTRQLVRQWAKDLGFSLVDQTKIVTAASELARNAVVYGGGGTVRFAQMQNATKRGLELVFEDQGPGIADIELAMRDGYTTGNGLGLGLGGAKRLVDLFEIRSKVGEGTSVKLTMWR